MADLNSLIEKDETPEDVATLYSWANLHGAKYRDFSASRAQTREKARLRAELAVEEEQQRMQREAEEARTAEARHGAEEPRDAEAAHQAQLAAEQATRQAEWASQHAAAQEAQRSAQQVTEEASRVAAEQAAQKAAHRAAQQAAGQAAQRSAERAQELAAQLAAQQVAEQEAQRSAERAQELAAQQAAQRAAELAAQEAAEQAKQQAAQQAAQKDAEQAQEHAAQQRAWQRPDRFPAAPFAVPAAPHSPPQPQNIDFAPSGRTRPFEQAPNQPSQPNYELTRDENSMPASNPWAEPNMPESNGRPAWLTPDRRQSDRPEPQSQSVSQSPVVAAPEDTLQGSRDRMTSRWFALRGVFDGTPAPVEPVSAPAASRAPALAVFSLAGGVGKTSLVATLGRALSARGERVLLVDTAAFGLLPFFFGATDQRPGLLRTFSPPGVSSAAPVQMVTIDPEGLVSEAPNQESLSSEIKKFSRGASRVIVDLATASGATTRQIMHLSPRVLVPVIPDMNSVVSVSSIDAFFEHNSNPAGKPELPFYVLNQFDGSLPLHLDVREVLREQLGERLLPFALRRTPAMSEALAEGMTVIDYAPNSSLADDFSTLASWVNSISAPATTSYRGIRWSER